MSDQNTRRPIVFLRGGRVALRPFELTDVPLLLAWVNEPELRQYLSRPTPVNEAGEREFVEKLSCRHDSFAFLTTDLATNEPIGCCSLQAINWTSRHAELGIFIADPSRRGAGRGPEVVAILLDYAFGTLNLHRCWLRVYADNTLAIRCYEQLGFVKEGADREAHFSSGRYVDVLRYSILDREWKLSPSPDHAGRL